jgi:hypothetical protein
MLPTYKLLLYIPQVGVQLAQQHYIVSCHPEGQDYQRKDYDGRFLGGMEYCGV